MSSPSLEILEPPSAQTPDELGARYAHVSRKAMDNLQEAAQQTDAGRRSHAEPPLDAQPPQPSHLPQESTPPSPPSPHALLPGASSGNPISIDSDDGSPRPRRSPPSPRSSLSLPSRTGVESIPPEVSTTSPIVRGELLDRHQVVPLLTLPDSSALRTHAVDASTAGTPPAVSSPEVAPNAPSSPSSSEPSNEGGLLADLPPFPQQGAPGVPLVDVRFWYDEVENARLQRRAVSTGLQAALAVVMTERLHLATAAEREAEAIRKCRRILRKLDAAHSRALVPSDAPTSSQSLRPPVQTTGKRAAQHDPSIQKRVRIDSGHSDAVQKGKAKAKPRWRPSTPLPHHPRDGSEDAGIHSDGTGEYTDSESSSAPLPRRGARRPVDAPGPSKPRRVRKKTVPPRPVGKGKAKAKESTPPPPPDDDSEPTDFKAMDDIIASITLASRHSPEPIAPHSQSPGPSNPGAFRALQKAAEVYRQQQLDRVDQEK